MFRKAGCLENGTGNPKTVPSRIVQNWNNMNLRGIEKEFSELIKRANAPTLEARAQRACFGAEYPKGCKYFRGPHPLQCYKTIWTKVKCVPEGYHHPDNISRRQNETIRSLNLNELEAYMTDIYTSAVHPKLFRQAQLDCYGMVFPKGCEGYFPPHDVECLKSIWKEVGCMEKGYDNPMNGSGRNRLVINTIDLRRVRVLMENTQQLAISASSGSKVASENQLRCFGIQFPTNCRYFRGAQSLLCYKEIWKDVGCLTSGRHDPDNYTGIQRAFIDKLNLLQIQTYMKKFTTDSKSGDANAQLDCYGMIFPRDCKSFLPSHDSKCLISAWESIGCLKEGWGYPGNLSTPAINNLANMKLDALVATLRQKLVATTKPFAFADQQECFGRRFPIGCVYYRGPNPLMCYKTIWKMVGCVDSGWENPGNLSLRKMANLNRWNIRQVISHMNNIHREALNRDAQAQRECFGIKFPRGCNYYRGPHSGKCYKVFWKREGCVEQGWKHPHNLRGATKAAWDSWTLHQIEDYVRHLNLKTHLPDKQAQLDCFGLGFPDGCINYRGPHSLECLRTMWKDVGCLEDGYDDPGNLTTLEYDVLNLGTLVYIRRHMDVISRRASARGGDAQLQCYGVVFPPQCTHYKGALPLRCLTAIWQAAGCKTVGLGYPKKLSPAQRLAQWRNYNIRLTILLIRKSPLLTALAGNATDQMTCFGLVFPKGCFVYDPPHSPECLRNMWNASGCIEGGYEHPDNLTKRKSDTLLKFNLIQLSWYMGNISEKALKLGQPLFQLACFGFKFPKDCKNYVGPLSLACLNEIWTDHGCVKEGWDYPTNLSGTKKQFVNSRNLGQFKSHVQDLALMSLAPDTTAQWECFGLEFPETCYSYRGPHSIDCIHTMRRQAGLAREGWNNPENVSRGQLNFFRTMNLRELLDYMTKIKDKALGGHVPSQFIGFGMEFFKNCKLYWPVLSRSCTDHIWLNEVGCVRDGTRYPQKLGYADFMNAWSVYNQRQVKAVIQTLKDHALNLNQSRVVLNGKVNFNGSITLAGSVEPDGSIVPKGKIFPQGVVVPEGTIVPKDGVHTNALNMEGAYLFSDAILLNGTIIPKKKTILRARMDDDHPITLNGAFTLEGALVLNGTFTPAGVLNPIRSTITPAGIRYTGIPVAPNDTAQLECYGLKFPLGCQTYSGPHEDHCISSVRKEAGLVPEGWNNPSNLTTQRRQFFDAMNLKQLIDHMKDVNRRALAWDRNAQKQGFGMEFFKDCTTYHPVLTLVCLNNIWREVVGCVDEGQHFPGKINNVRLNRLYGSKNQRQVKKSMDVVKFDAFELQGPTRPGEVPIAANKTAQLECFGIPFPIGCLTYKGPHTDLCYNTIRKEAGLAPEGWNNAKNMTKSERDALDLLNIRDIIDYMKNIEDKALKGDKDSQRIGFGMDFFENCTRYYPVLSLNCLNSIWKGVVGCEESGEGYPGRLTFDQLNEEYGDKNQRQVKAVISSILIGAFVQSISNPSGGTIVAANTSAQKECFGIEFATGCTTFRGPFSVECIHSIREAAGLVREGWNNPENWTIPLKRYFDAMNMRQLLGHMREVNRQALGGNFFNQNQGFGMRFLPNCTFYHPTLTLNCLNSIWKGVTCVEEGLGYPESLNDSTFDSRWSDKNQRQVRTQMLSIYRNALIPSDVNGTYQEECYGLVFPDGCYTYRGPHSNRCIQSCRRRAGLADEGWNNPLNISKALNATFQAMNLNQLIKYFQDIADAAFDDDVDSQYDGFGMELYPNCPSYHAPLTMECLVTIWIVIVGCEDGGYGYPEDTSRSLLGVVWNNKNQREIKDAMQLIKDIADTPNEVYKKECFGRGVPIWMFVATALGIKLVLIALAFIILNRRTEVLQLKK